MKINDRNAISSEPMIEPMLGQILSPVTAQAFETRKTFDSDDE